MKILTIVGARPQFVKAAVLSRKIQEYSSIEETILHTGQHYDPSMSQIFFDQMSIPQPKHTLATGGGSHAEMTAAMLLGIEPVVLKEKPDLVLVYGDTNSTLAGALVAAKLSVPIAHVEAGLRSFNREMPEEINRVLTDQLSSWLFCPTEAAKKNLEKEGVDSEQIYTVGDIMYEATLFYREKLKPSSEISDRVEAVPEFVLASIHRSENTDDPQKLREIVAGLEEIASTTPVFLPLHPRTKKRMEEIGLDFDNVTTFPPAGYADMLFLLQHCQLVITDSGGLQKEAYFFSKPCLTLRNETEWVETIESGVNVLVEAKSEKIVETYVSIGTKNIVYPQGLYGMGNTSDLILKNL